MHASIERLSNSCAKQVGKRGKHNVEVKIVSSLSLSLSLSQIPQYFSAPGIDDLRFLSCSVPVTKNPFESGWTYYCICVSAFGSQLFLSSDEGGCCLPVTVTTYFY
jgi:hypothetical protein